MWEIIMLTINYVNIHGNFVHTTYLCLPAPSQCLQAGYWNNKVA